MLRTCCVLSDVKGPVRLLLVPPFALTARQTALERCFVNKPSQWVICLFCLLVCCMLSCLFVCFEEPRDRFRIRLAKAVTTQMTSADLGSASVPSVQSNHPF